MSIDDENRMEESSRSCRTRREAATTAELADPRPKTAGRSESAERRSLRQRRRRGDGPRLRDPRRRPRRARPLPLPHRPQARPRRRGRDRDHRPGQTVRPRPHPQRPQPRPARGPGLDGARPLGNRQERADQAHRRPALPGLRRRPRARRIDPEHDRRRTLRGAQKVRPAVPGRRPLRLDEHLRQRRLPAAPAHRQRRGGDRRDRQPPAAKRSASPRRPTRCRTSSPAGCASAPASPGRWSWNRRS